MTAPNPGQDRKEPAPAKSTPTLVTLSFIVGVLAVVVTAFGLSSFRLLVLGIALVAILPAIIRVSFPGVKEWKYWDTVLIGALAVVVVTGGFAIIRKASANPGPAPRPKPDHSPVTKLAVAGQVRRTGVLVMAGNGTAYDLDSLAPDWGASVGAKWVDQDVEYVPDWKHGEPALFLTNEPASDVLMGTRGHWTYQDCVHAAYNQSYSSKSNPNTIAGSALDPGHGICILTVNTTKPHSTKPLKTDGGHYALLVVKARTGSTLTVMVTVWQ